MVAPVIPWLRARISQYGIEFRPDVGSIRDPVCPARDYHASPLLPLEEKDRKRRPTDKSNGSIFSSTEREIRDTWATWNGNSVGNWSIERQRERERGSVEDGDDRLHKRLERESLRRGFCARVPDGWRHCRALKNTPRVGGVQLSPLFSVFIPPPRKFLQPRIFKK